MRFCVLKRNKHCNQQGLYLQNNKTFIPINPGNFASLSFKSNVHQFAKISAKTGFAATANMETSVCPPTKGIIEDNLAARM